MQRISRRDAASKFMQELKMRVFYVLPVGSVLMCIHSSLRLLSEAPRTLGARGMTV